MLGQCAVTWFLGVLCALPSSSSVADSTDESLPRWRFHVAWGGGAATEWEGSIEVPGGRISRLRLLGLYPDESSGIYLAERGGGRINVDHPSARTYDGAEFDVTASLDSRIRVVLRRKDRPQQTKTIELPVANLVASFHTAQLDDTNNRLVIRRAPGDELRIGPARDNMIFDAGTNWDVSVVPYYVEQGIGKPLRLEASLHPARQEEELWSDSRAVQLDEFGNATAPIAFSIPLPQADGVYDIEFRLKSGRLRDTIVGSAPLATRRIQIVVLQPTSAPPERDSGSASSPQDEVPRFEELWHPVDTWHPTKTGWSDWLARLPAAPWLQRSFSRQPLGNDRASIEQVGGESWTQLKPGGWQAYPLPIAQPGRPHIVEIEFPVDTPQALGIRIVEPDAAGRVMNVGLENGIQVPWTATLVSDEPQRHRLLFWPQSEAPVLVLVNHDPERPALFGQIRVLSGPERLPAAPRVRSQTTSRLAAVYFHKPFWPATFSATQGLDQVTGRSLDDWQSFYEAATRLIEYLQFVGYNGAVVCVAAEGSALYPSRHLGANPKYDTGTYFTNGQDPVQKDVVELLMRLFDRAGLTMVPAVELSGTLPELEQLRRQGNAEGLILSDGTRAWQVPPGTWKAAMPPYNPLDLRVQTVIEKTFGELARRYDSHPSFGGIAWLVGGQGVGLFPGDQWGRDPETVQRFESDFRSERAETPGASPTPDDWLQWRARQLLAFQRRLQKTIAANAQDVDLYIVTADLFAENDVKQDLRPDLLRPTDFGKQLVRYGLAPDRYRNEDHIILVQTQRIPPPFDPARYWVSYQQRTQRWQELYQGARRPAVLLFSEPIWRSLPTFDYQSPFGADRTQLTVFSHLAAPPKFARERFVRAMAEQDVSIMLHGGWEVALGGEEELRKLWVTWTSLPAGSFTAVPSSQRAGSRQAITVRVLQQESGTYVYFLNAAPWPMAVSVSWQYDRNTPIESLGPHNAPHVDATASAPTWQLALEPFDLVAYRIDSPSARIMSWQATGGHSIGPVLAEAIRTVRAQANALRSPTPISSLTNAGFEATADDGIPGWRFSQAHGVTARLDDSTSFEGKRSLHLKSEQGIAWLRSASLPAPRTGRVFVLARLRTSDPDHQPPLRISIDGRRDGQPYYRSARVGAGGEGIPKIGKDWGTQPFLLPIIDLPTSGWQDFRIGFDLMGPGEVWIDDVQVYDMYFLSKERQELMLRIAVQESLVQQGRWMSCYEFLEGFWPQMLFTELKAPPARVARAWDQPSETREPKPSPDETEPEPSFLDRFKPKWPKRWFPF